MDGGYHYGPNQIVGMPERLSAIRYDIEARVSEPDVAQWNDPALQPSMLRTMLQAMLADRFQLAVHRDRKVVPVYEMRVGGRRPKFEPSEGASLSTVQQKHPNARPIRGGAIVASGPNPGEQWLFNATMPILGEFLSTMAGRPIQDQTGLTGKYDLNWQLELPSSSQTGPATPPEFFSSQIFDVVRDQLGLKLKPAMGSMESLVIDHVEPPSAN